ncbi:MLLT1 super elongation complex subunit [Phyllostomus discolor]|uniref:MLLT1 super elongation complex subunit n=1 Tax=Phyllostomus discolor TaxID=89673 RepID=A0A833ZMI4_9CHIR|nr:protein ENL isoform X3 [Phyllostomus hastatus]KAF6095458.1 MLLT1 super elongation complex subunit [Phyllostomus discolor]
MDNQCTVQVKLELGHRAQLRKKPTTEGFTHDWMVFVRGPEQCEIQHFVEKVVFRLHDSFPKPKRVCKEPPYKVEESGYAGFIMPIEVYFKNKEEPRKVCFTYDLFLNLEGNPPVNHLRCEKLTFNNPTIEFRYKLLMAGGDASRESGKACKTHKTAKEHRERPRKDSESKGPSKEPEREQARSAKDTARKLVEGRPPKEEKAPPPKAAFKEPKMALKETKLESLSPKGGPPPPPQSKSSSKRPAAADSPKPSAKKQKKSSSKGSRSTPGTSPRTSSSSFSDKKSAKDKGSVKVEKIKAESEPREIKKPLEVEESNSEDEASFKTESAQSSPSNSSSSSDSSSDSDFEPSQNHSQGPLRSMVEDLQSEESDEDDSSSGEEAAGKTNAGRDSRLSFSDSDSDNSADSCLPSREPPPSKKPPPPNSKASGRRSPESCSKPEKILKRGTYDKAYTDELVELHRRLMALRERNVLQQIVNLIEETGHFNVTNTTFDFDLFSLDETTRPSRSASWLWRNPPSVVQGCLVLLPGLRRHSPGPVNTTMEQ